MPEQKCVLNPRRNAMHYLNLIIHSLILLISLSIQAQADLNKIYPLQINTQTAIQTVDEKFLSFAIDTSLAFGGYWWSENGSAKVSNFNFNNPKLQKLTMPLLPAYLRIGGTASDKTIYDLDGRPAPAASSASETLTLPQWDSLNHFAQNLGLDVVFTLNAGPEARVGQKGWNPEYVRELIHYTVAHHYPVKVWELGNEINLYGLNFGLRGKIELSRYEDDLREAKKLLAEEDPTSRLTGFSSAFWPILGEIIQPLLTRSTSANDALDIVSWHYYPTQSDRFPLVRLRPSNENTVIATKTLNEFKVLSPKITEYVAAHFPSAQLWLGETGQAQLGGQRGISDRYISGLWWLDELGLGALTGQKVVVRQSLVGSQYGMLSQDTLGPNPDYWNSLFWKKLMGRHVLHVTSEGLPDTLRVYAHCTPQRANEYRPGALTVLALNIDSKETHEFSLASLMHQNTYVYRFSSKEVLSQDVELNGAVLKLDANENVPFFNGQRVTSSLQNLPPRTYAFFVLADAHAEACSH